MQRSEETVKEYFVKNGNKEQRNFEATDITQDENCRTNFAAEKKALSTTGIKLVSPKEQNMFNHVIHPHPHRRHYPHHLIDHFSRDLTHQSSTNLVDVVQNPDSSPVDPRYQTETTESGEMNTARVSPRVDTGNGFRRENLERNVESGTNRLSEQKSSVDRTYSNFREPQPWPFFGTESRVLPSGRRVSFLKQACIGFSLTSTRDKSLSDNTPTVCPKAFREPSFGNTPRRSLIRSGPKVAELRQKFTSIAESPPKQPSRQSSVDLNKFKNESMKGPIDRLHGDTVNDDIKTCVTIIDSSSTKGKNPVPKATSLRSAVKPAVAPKPKTVKSVSTSPMRHKTKQFQSKSTSPSPTRRKESPPSWKAPGVDKPTITPPPIRSNSRGPKIIIPKSQTPPQTPKPVIENIVPKTFKPMTALPKASKKDNNAKNAKKQGQVRTPKDENSASSDSLSKESSLVVVDGDAINAEEVTSTYEELSVEASELSDRNFLIDYGDPSRFYFRNEWEARMQELDEHTMNMRDKLSKFCTDEQVYRGAIEIIEDVENLKEEMGELYDYFDHFEREEDTLLQQVQRQLTQANRYCKVLHYRVERAQQQRADDKKVHELEEELKLSRQVAVSLHWELQAADAKQAKLEQENIEMRHRLLQAETSRETLKIQVTRLQNSIDQMSLHAPSQMIMPDDSNGGVTSSDSSSEMKRQIQFMEEKDEVMLSRLVDLQAEKDSLKDELEQYRDQYGELSTVPSSGANRHTDLKLRLKLAEDQAGLLARKVIELQLENDNMIKLAAEKELMAKEALKRNPSVSDLQFLEDERESLRLALDEMEIENQKLAAELLRYKQAVHRQLHSNSISTESPLDVGVILRVPRSNDSVFDDENNNKTSRSHKTDDRSSSHHDSISEHVGGDRKKLRPLSLTSPLNQSSNQKRGTKMSISRTLSDIAIPLSPDTKSQSVQITPTISSNTTQGPKSTTTATNCSRKSFCHKCKRTKKLKMVDVAIETEKESKTALQSPIKETTKSVATCTLPIQQSSRSQATSPIITNLQSLFQPALDVVTQIRQRKRSTKSEATSPIPGITPSTSTFAFSPTRSGPRPHNALLEEMRKQLANVRNIAESMDNVVNVEPMDVELERKGRELVEAECKKVTDRVLQKKKIAKLAKSLQKYVKEMEVSVADESERSESLDVALSEVNGWDLHGNAEVSPIIVADPPETSTITLSSSTDDLVSLATVRSLATRIQNSSFRELSLGVFEGIILVVMAHVLLTSLPASALFKIFFLLLVFFVC